MIGTPSPVRDDDAPVFFPRLRFSPGVAVVGLCSPRGGSELEWLITPRASIYLVAFNEKVYILRQFERAFSIPRVRRDPFP